MILITSLLFGSITRSAATDRLRSVSYPAFNFTRLPLILPVNVWCTLSTQCLSRPKWQVVQSPPNTEFRIR
jgi:hypothetical protein